MVDINGLVQIIDMGTAKKLTKKPFKTFTIIGTPHYMAPEILVSRGYSFNVDLWSLGILLYELMCGYCPFGEDLSDPFEIYREIITCEFDFPVYVRDASAIKLIKQLLNRRPLARLGKSWAHLKANKWFSDFDFVNYF